MAVKAVPEGWHSVTPRLFVHEAAKLVDFLIHAFGATGTFRTDGPSEIRIGDSIVMVGEVGVREAMPTFLYLYLDDMGAAYRRSLASPTSRSRHGSTTSRLRGFFRAGAATRT